METPGPNAPFWASLFAGLGLSAATLGWAYRVIRMPLKRLAAAESRLDLAERHAVDQDKEITMNRESIERLHDDHVKLREMILAQPTKEDLNRSETRTMERVAVSEANVNGNISRLYDILNARPHSSH
jgi:hypothetical protein